jgi:hypothetical protein
VGADRWKADPVVIQARDFAVAKEIDIPVHHSGAALPASGRAI